MELSNNVDEESSVFQPAGVTSNESADGSADLRTRDSEENLGGPEPSAFIAIGHEHTEEPAPVTNLSPEGTPDSTPTKPEKSPRPRLDIPMIPPGVEVPSSNRSELAKYFTIDKGKIIATFLAIGFILHHGVMRWRFGADSCNWLLTKGRFQGRTVWQPYGCMMHDYSMQEAHTCLRYVAYWGGRNHYVFLGDSRIRQVYVSMVSLLSGKPYQAASPHKDDHYRDERLNLHLEFLWQPMVNESMLKVYKRWIEMGKKGSQDKPNAIITGSGTWSIKLNNGSEDALENFKVNLSYIAPYFNKLKETTKVLWMLQEPVVEEKLSPNRAMITNQQIMKYNKVAASIIEESAAELWTSNVMIAKSYLKDSVDGIHISDPALKLDSQILLNMYCNNHMNYNDGTCCSDGEPVTVLQIITACVFGICFVMLCLILMCRLKTRRCRRNGAANGADHEHVVILNGVGGKLYESVASSTPGATAASVASEAAKLCPINTAASVASDLVFNPGSSSSSSSSASTDSGKATTFSRLRRLSGNNRRRTKTRGLHYRDSCYTFFFTMTKLGFIMGYFFLCDRANFFMKENKHFTHINFFLPVAYVAALGIFFHDSTEKTGVLHRDQTDEWKGWMQVCILIYHLTGASQALPIYMHIRVLVTAYLFLSGYGHFTYFWNESNASISRLCEIIFRLNLLTVILCFTMNRPYQFYYFVPLVSFWFMIQYLFVIVWPRVSNASAGANPLHYFYTVLKFVALIAVITILYMSEVFFEKVFLTRPFKALFVTSDDSVHEWWFRWQLDRYSVLIGMVFAYGLQLAKNFQLIDDSSDKTLTLLPCGGWKGSFIATAISVLGVLTYTTYVTFWCKNKTQCNDIHPYISAFPVIGFILLRNIPGWFRSRYSSFFAWFGKISLELFISQYHIWLAADTHGVLVLLPDYPVLNVILTSFIFVCAAHEIHNITATLKTYFIPNEWKLCLRNLLLFLLILLPLGFDYGML